MELQPVVYGSFPRTLTHSRFFLADSYLAGF